MRRMFVYDNGSPTSLILKELAIARAEKREIYLIARIVEVLQNRDRLEMLVPTENKSLSREEKIRLKDAIRSARFGKKPMAVWLPRGYQIARLLMTYNDLYPGETVRPTPRDIKSMRLAAAYYRKNNDHWSRRQLASLRRTARFLGIHI